MEASEIAPSDEDLVRRARAGDAQARTALVERFEARLRVSGSRRDMAKRLNPAITLSSCL